MTKESGQRASNEFLKDGIEAVERGDYGQAIQHFQQATSALPQNPWGLEWEGAVDWHH